MALNFQKDIVLENHRALLRPLQQSDFDNLLPLCKDDEKLIQYSPKPIYTPELLTEHINTALTDRKREQRYPFIIYDKQAKAYAGSTSYLNVNNPNSVVEIGHTWLGRAFQKTGINRNCKYLLLHCAFDKLGFKRVELRTDERNLQSRQAIEKIGGKQEGLFRSHMLMSDGFRRNTVIYAILPNEFAEAVNTGFWKNEMPDSKIEITSSAIP